MSDVGGGDRLREDARRFGARVVDRRFATREQVEDCLREQAELEAGGVFRNLGEILVEQGFMTASQVKMLLEEEKQVIMYCPRCSERYNVLRQWTAKARCPADGEALAETERETSVHVAATLDPSVGPPDSPIGRDIGGCRVVELLGRGSMGSVYKAKHVGLDRYVAIKLMPSVAGNPSLVKRLLFEARAVAKLEHPNIVQVYDVGYQHGFFFIVMQLLRGQTLEDRIAEIEFLETGEALDVAREIAKGLAAAHALGIIHRDLKPANIMLTEDGRARIMDFGLAQDPGAPDQWEGSLVGTPRYMSPEQWLGHKADERSDLYALGVALYHMLTGKLPFTGTNVQELMHQHLKVLPIPPQEHNPSLPVPVCAIVRKLMAKAPARRYAHASDFLADVDRTTSGQDPEAMREFGPLNRCGFCEALNAPSEKKCMVCGESLGASPGPIELVARPDEFKCPGCGELAQKGSRHCPGCGKSFCLHCGKRLAVLKGYCPYCVGQIKQR